MQSDLSFKSQTDHTCLCFNARLGEGPGEGGGFGWVALPSFLPGPLEVREGVPLEQDPALQAVRGSDCNFTPASWGCTLEQQIPHSWLTLFGRGGESSGKGSSQESLTPPLSFLHIF